MNSGMKAMIETLRDILASANAVTEEATWADNQNQAVGTIMALENKLTAARALYDAILAVHRNGGAQ